jgi:hypothetical protein
MAAPTSYGATSTARSPCGFAAATNTVRHIRRGRTGAAGSRGHADDRSDLVAPAARRSQAGSDRARELYSPFRQVPLSGLSHGPAHLVSSFLDRFRL